MNNAANATMPPYSWWFSYNKSFLPEELYIATASLIRISTKKKNKNTPNVRLQLSNFEKWTKNVFEITIIVSESAKASRYIWINHFSSSFRLKGVPLSGPFFRFEINRGEAPEPESLYIKSVRSIHNFPTRWLIIIRPRLFVCIVRL